MARWRGVAEAYRARDDLIGDLSARLTDPELAREADLAGIVRLQAYARGLAVGAQLTGDPERFREYVDTETQLGHALDRAVLVAQRRPGAANDVQLADVARRLDASRLRVDQAGSAYNTAVGVYNNLLGGGTLLTRAQTLLQHAEPLPLIRADMISVGALDATLGPAVGGASLRLTGVVPVVCSVQITKPLVAGAGPDKDPAGKAKRIPLGRLDESCNSGGGFDTYATTSPIQPGAFFIVDNQRIAVSATGSTLVDTASNASIQSRNVAYETDGAPPSMMTFTIRAR